MYYSSLVCKHDTPALDLLDVETHQRFAMWAIYGERADGSKPKVWTIAAKWRFLKCYKASAHRGSAPDCQIPLRRRHETVDHWAGDVVNGTIPLSRSLHLQVLGRGFSSIADNFVLHLLAFIERA